MNTSKAIRALRLKGFTIIGFRSKWKISKDTLDKTMILSSIQLIELAQRLTGKFREKKKPLKRK